MRTRSRAAGTGQSVSAVMGVGGMPPAGRSLAIRRAWRQVFSGEEPGEASGERRTGQHEVDLGGERRVAERLLDMRIEADHRYRPRAGIALERAHDLEDDRPGR